MTGAINFLYLAEDGTDIILDIGKHWPFLALLLLGGLAVIGYLYLEKKSLSKIILAKDEKISQVNEDRLNEAKEIIALATGSQQAINDARDDYKRNVGLIQQMGKDTLDGLEKANSNVLILLEKSQRELGDKLNRMHELILTGKGNA